MANILILSNDAFRVKAKTCESLAAACRRLGHFALVRDTADARFGLQVAQGSKEFYENLASKYLRLIEFFEIDTLLALDLDWLLLPDEFLLHPKINRIVSLWFDDLYTWSIGPVHEFFPSQKQSPDEILRHEKVLHCFYGRGQMLEAELLGIQRQKFSPLAAARELLDANFPLQIRNKLAFVGNPGCRQQPHPEIVQRMHQGAELEELRRLASEFILRFPPEEMKQWIQDEPTTKDLMEFALRMRVLQPFTPACEILKTASSGFSRAFDYLKEKKQFLIACLLIKLVNQYDRPAFIYRAYQKGWLDVFSAQDEWKLYGVESKPFVSAPRITELYQSYPAHLNAPNPLRDATANEKLFELAACARASINLRSPDVTTCFSENEIGLVDSLQQLEPSIAKILENPQEILALGQAARTRAAQEHTWDHRLSEIFS